jgi:hypothetical protein
VAGRQAAHEGVVGCFSHVSYLRLRVKKGEPFRDRLRSVSHVFYKAVFHQDCGRMVLSHPDLLGGTFYQWLSWHPAELSGPELYDIPDRAGIAVQPVRFQTASELANVPPGVTDLDTCFFECAGDIGVLLIGRPGRFVPSTLERFLETLRSSARQVIHDAREAG